MLTSIVMLTILDVICTQVDFKVYSAVLKTWQCIYFNPKAGTLSDDLIRDNQTHRYTLCPPILPLAVRPQQRVDSVDNPVEEAAVESFTHGVPHLHCFFHCVGSDDRLSAGHNTVGGQGFLQLVWADTKQRCHWGDMR